MNTIVSAFVDLGSHYKDKDIQKYIELGIKLLSIDVPKIIFLEPSSYYFLKDKLFPKTHFILIKKNNLFMWDLKESFKRNQIKANPQKDNSEYFTIIANKTEWMSSAIDLNPFKTDQFTWIDFGIFHVIRDETLFTKYIQQISSKQYQKIRIASIWDLTQLYNIDWQKKIMWYFAGGVFGGPASSLKEFAKKTKQLYLDTITDIGYIPWEVNIWYLVYKQSPELFDPYYGNHDVSILENY